MAKEEMVDVLSDFINLYTEYDRYLDYAKKKIFRNKN